MPPNFNRFRTVLSRRGRRSSFPVTPKESVWKRLPDNVLVKLVSLCGLEEIVSLALTCRLLHRRVFKNELAISHSYMNLRRNLSTSGDEDISISPGDDLTFISELFPPPPPQYAVGDGHADADYSFAYLADLQRCWKTCIHLSYYLAEYTVRHHLETDPIARPLWNSSKTEKEFVYSKAVAMLHEKLIYPLYVICLHTCQAIANFRQCLRDPLPRMLCGGRFGFRVGAIGTLLQIRRRPAGNSASSTVHK